MNKNKNEFRYIFVIAILIAIFVFFVQIGASKLVDVLDTSVFLSVIIWAVSALVISFVIVLAFTYLSSRVENVITILRRRYRFENLSNPLLLRLSYEAPGTYHHSLNVSNLAQRACKEIGADSLLARVASYYHDIGKLGNPTKFIENQAHAEIPTDESKTSIKKDAKEIISHVKKGVEIAQENNLPDDMITIILEHHGTTRAEYFFERAKEKGVKVKYTDFRYPGPTPESKEAAIIMLADNVEAIARSKEYLSDNIIQTIVEKAIENKLTEGQLKNANFSESEIAKIRSSLIKTLSSIYHQRISYEVNGKN